MHIQLEANAKNTISSYDLSKVVVNGELYQDSFILSNQSLITPWPVDSLADLTESTLTPIIQLNPDVILIGHTNIGALLPITIQSWLSTQRIGIECMPIGAACRTFNVLLSENRNVVVGFIMDKNR